MVGRADGDRVELAGNPRKAAAAILAALDAPEPPLRLALGADAVDAIRAKHERLRGDLDGREAVSRDTAQRTLSRSYDARSPLTSAKTVSPTASRLVTESLSSVSSRPSA
jgi:hypothetical protein